MAVFVMYMYNTSWYLMLMLLLF